MVDYINRTSMNFWYPKVKDLDIPMPKTEIILFKEDPSDWWNFLDDKWLSDSEKKLLHETAAHFGYPLFMKNDLTSSKHDFEESCYVPNESTLERHMYSIIEDAAVRDALMSSIVLREYIELDWRFKAFRGLPTAPERRYFIDHGKVSCHHPY